MAVLLLRLAGPMQSWGAESKFEVRRTELYPTKSGVIGMLASALGRSREEDISDLSALKVGVRADQPGTVIKDFHTAHNEKSSYITSRYYLSDAAFLVGIESDDKALLEQLQQALKAPAYPLFLGRRSCPPDFPMDKGIQEGSLEEVLTSCPSLKGNPESMEILLEADGPQDGSLLRDVPVSFSIKHRKYKNRFIKEKRITFPKKDTTPLQKEPEVPEHDPFVELEEVPCI